MRDYAIKLRAAGVAGAEWRARQSAVEQREKRAWQKGANGKQYGANA